MISFRKPRHFRSTMEVAACFCEYKDMFLLLLRQDDKPEGNTWCLPAGKIENEDPEEGVRREVYEETGIILPHIIVPVQKVYVQYEQYSFTYHLYRAPVTSKEVVLNPKEHKRFVWVTPKEALRLHLIQDEDVCIRIRYNMVSGRL